MTGTTWHVDVALLRRYAAGALEDAAAWSLEAHLTGCARCRALLGPVTHPVVPSVAPSLVPEERLAAVWSSVDERIRARQRPVVERLLVRLGVPDHDARLLAATPSLTGSWLLGVAVTLAAGVVATWLTRSVGTSSLLGFLLVAPLVPLAGVAVAFGPRVDPTYELGITAPISTVRLLLVRAVAVLATSVVLGGVAALALPSVGLFAAAWLVPSLALTAATLAASTRWSPALVAGTVALSWTVGVAVLELATRTPLVVFRPPGQLALVALLAVSVAVLATQRERLDPAARA